MLLVIISCPHLYSKRVPQLLDNIDKCGLGSICSSTIVICGNDESIAKRINCKYTPEYWDSDIKAGWGAFLGNMISVKEGRQEIDIKKRRRIIKTLVSNYDYSVLLPPRHLSRNEISVFYRHIYACMMISNLNEPAIILEDDAQIIHSERISGLVESLSEICSETAFIDLADDYIPSWATGIAYECSNKWEYLRYKVAITRTLIGYVLDPGLASLLYGASNSFSLPIDMHYQKIFCCNGVRGFRLVTELLKHGSKSGMYESSIN